jgi:DNA polymerase alpha subunit A
VRKLDQLPLPFDIHQKIKGKTTTVYNTEKQMLEMFINKLYVIDPDLLVAHNLCGSMIEILLARISFLRIAHWSRIGRLKRSQMPTRKLDHSGANSWIPRIVSCGRLLVDTFLNSKELIRETNYDLGNLART